jgi:hypothetical protein
MEFIYLLGLGGIIVGNGGAKGALSLSLSYNR